MDPLVKRKWCKFRGLCLHSTNVVFLPNGIKMFKRDWRLQSLTYNSKWKTEKRWEQTTDYWLSAAVHETKSPFSIQCCLILFWWITIMKWQLWTNCYQYGFLRNIYVVRIRVVCNLPKYPDIQVSGYHISTFLIKPYLVYCRKFANPYLVPKLSLLPWFCIPLRENYLFVVQDQPLSVSKRW